TRLYDSLAVFAIVTALGVLTLSRHERSTVFWNGVMLIGLVAVSLLHIVEGGPGDLFSRVWIPLAILMTGATGQVAWVLIAEGWSRLVRLRRHVPSQAAEARSGFSALLAPSTWTLVGAIAVGGFILSRIERGVIEGLRDLIDLQQIAWHRDLYQFDSTQ